jgi:hypothetical protein
MNVRLVTSDGRNTYDILHIGAVGRLPGVIRTNTKIFVQTALFNKDTPDIITYCETDEIFISSGDL